MTTLTACLGSNSEGRIKAGLQLPPMPANLQRSVSDPGVVAGQDARVVIARTRKSLAVCRGRLGGSNNYYADVRREFNK